MVISKAAKAGENGDIKHRRSWTQLSQAGADIIRRSYGVPMPARGDVEGVGEMRLIAAISRDILSEETAERPVKGTQN